MLTIKFVKRWEMINPRELKASEIKMLVALYNHSSKKPPVVTGYVFTKEQVIDVHKLSNLIDKRLVTIKGDYVSLSSSGVGIARSFKDRPILGDD